MSEDKTVHVIPNFEGEREDSYENCIRHLIISTRVSSSSLLMNGAGGYLDEKGYLTVYRNTVGVCCS